MKLIYHHQPVSSYHKYMLRQSLFRMMTGIVTNMQVQVLKFKKGCTQKCTYMLYQLLTLQIVIGNVQSTDVLFSHRWLHTYSDTKESISSLYMTSCDFPKMNRLKLQWMWHVCDAIMCTWVYYFSFVYPSLPCKISGQNWENVSFFVKHAPWYEKVTFTNYSNEKATAFDKLKFWKRSCTWTKIRH